MHGTLHLSLRGYLRPLMIAAVPLLLVRAAAAADPDCDGEVRVDGTILGYSPDPGAVLVTPGDIAAPHPLVGARVEARSADASCPASETGLVRPDGSFSLILVGLSKEARHRVRVELGTDHFVLPDGSGSASGYGLEARGDLSLTATLNEQAEEFGSFAILTFHHLRRATEEAARVLEEQGLAWRVDRPERLAVTLARDDLARALDPGAGILTLASDEARPYDASGLPRKIVPTAIYHEVGRDVIYRFCEETAADGIHAGIADAFACFIAGQSLYGYASAALPSADPAARDLRNDLVLYPADSRRAVAGAFWELWESTLDPPQVGAEGPPRSSFTLGLLFRWLASRSGPHGTARLEYAPSIGQQLYLKADYEALGGDGDYRNGVPFDDELIRAFGRRNLFQHTFRRGDANLDDALDIGDGIALLGYLFLDSSEHPCGDAMDFDDDGEVEVTDAINLLGHLFLGGGPPAAPYPSCGHDETPEDGLPCWRSPCRIIPPNR